MGKTRPVGAHHIARAFTIAPKPRFQLATLLCHLPPIVLPKPDRQTYTKMQLVDIETDSNLTEAAPDCPILDTPCDGTELGALPSLFF